MAFSSSFARMPCLARGQPTSRRTPLRIRAQDVEPELENPEFSFKSNTRSGVGYVEEDSAGQTNVFAVQPRQYVAGSLDDENADDNSNVIVGVGGAVLGLLVVGLGVTALTSLGGGTSPIDDVSQFQTLSQYKAEFESSLASSEAPALTE